MMSLVTGRCGSLGSTYPRSVFWAKTSKTVSPPITLRVGNALIVQISTVIYKYCLWSANLVIAQPLGRYDDKIGEMFALPNFPWSGVGTKRQNVWKFSLFHSNVIVIGDVIAQY